MKKQIKSIIIIASFILLMTLPYFVFAADNPAVTSVGTPLSNLQEVGSGSGPYSTETSDTSLAETIGLVINMLLSLMGVIFVGLMVYAGYSWMMARGEEEKVTIAKDTIKRAVIGLVITVSSYAIWSFIYTNFISK